MSSNISFQSYGHVTMGTSLNKTRQLDLAKGPAFACTGAFGWKGCYGSGAYTIVGVGDFACPSCFRQHGYEFGHNGELISRITLEIGTDMCDKQEIKTTWDVRIEQDSKKRYTARFMKRDFESGGYNHSASNVEKSFDTFEDAMKWVNDTYKSLK